MEDVKKHGPMAAKRMASGGPIPRGLSPDSLLDQLSGGESILPGRRHGASAKARGSDRDRPRDGDGPEVFGTEAYWRRRFREQGSPWTGRFADNEPDIASIRDPKRVIFLSRGYLATSDRPGVAVAAAQLRAALAAGAGEAQLEKARQKLRRRMVKELRADIAAAWG